MVVAVLAVVVAMLMVVAYASRISRAVVSTSDSIFKHCPCACYDSPLLPLSLSQSSIFFLISLPSSLFRALFPFPVLSSILTFLSSLFSSSLVHFFFFLLFLISLIHLPFSSPFFALFLSPPYCSLFQSFSFLLVFLYSFSFFSYFSFPLPFSFFFFSLFSSTFFFVFESFFLSLLSLTFSSFYLFFPSFCSTSVGPFFLFLFFFLTTRCYSSARSCCFTYNLYPSFNSWFLIIRTYREALNAQENSYYFFLFF